MSDGKHVGNMRLSKNGKGINIHIFKNKDYFTVSLDRVEALLDEAKVTGKSDITIPILYFPLDSPEILKEKKGKK